MNTFLPRLRDKVKFYLTYERQHVAPAIEKAVESFFFTGAGCLIAAFLQMQAEGDVFTGTINTWPHAALLWLGGSKGQIYMLVTFVTPWLRGVQGWVQSKQTALKAPAVPIPGQQIGANAVPGEHL